MTIRSIIPAFLFVLTLHSVATARGITFSADEKRIIELEDRRSGVKEIENFLHSSDERTAHRAAIALANIGDTSARHSLIAALKKETRPLIIDAIAFALGVLGPDHSSYDALLEKIKANGFTDQTAIGIARSVPKEKAPAFISMLGSAVNIEGAAHGRSSSGLSAALALTELGLRKLINDDAIAIVKFLESELDPAARWHAIYALARTTDSALLFKHIDVISDYLNDIGSPECRMFAATALGNIHNIESSRMLLTQARSELEWRVRVNVFNAMGKQPFFSSGIFEVMKSAVLECSADSAETIHPALAALDALDKMIEAGKVSSSDSITVRDWLAEFNPDHNDHDDKPIAIRAFALIPAARFGEDCIGIRSMIEIFSHNDPAASQYLCRALGNFRDTSAIYVLIRRLIATSWTQTHHFIEGIQGQWKLWQTDSAYHSLMDRSFYTAALRHLIIRISDQNDEPSVIGSAMEAIEMPGIVTDSFKVEAEQYMLKYLRRDNFPNHSDQLVSLLDATQHLHFRSPEFIGIIDTIYANAAEQWGDEHLAKYALATLDSLGAMNIHKHEVKLIRDSIDWETLASTPDTVIVPTKYGLITIKLLLDDAPLTSLNILRLANGYYFNGNLVHRVVPNFVIQTGDLKNTGWGTPPWRVRTEISEARYDSAGVAGMASDGKDTEGAQWFITHCPTPHLDTRYTIWGTVVRGLDRVNKIQVGDKIETVIVAR